jgi:hypothetical protein
VYWLRPPSSPRLCNHWLLLEDHFHSFIYFIYLFVCSFMIYCSDGSHGRGGATAGGAQQRQRQPERVSLHLAGLAGA